MFNRKTTEQRRRRVTAEDRMLEDMAAIDETESFCPDWERLQINPTRIREPERNARMILSMVLVSIGLSFAGPSEALLDAIREVESNGRAYVMGDGGRAAGAYQIWKIYVDDVNRIAGTSFTYDDRLDERKSREMVKIYLSHYGKGLSEFDLARLHVGGPDGHKQACTLSYARKVLALMK